MDGPRVMKCCPNCGFDFGMRKIRGPRTELERAKAALREAGFKVRGNAAEYQIWGDREFHCPQSAEDLITMVKRKGLIP